MDLRQSDGTPIQLLHLATHTSGLPNLASNYDQRTAWNYSVDDLFDFTENYRPHNVGESYLYSNLGFCLLGQALRRIQANKKMAKLFFAADGMFILETILNMFSTF